MSSYLGSWKIDDLLTFTIVTHRVDTGAATDADSAPAYRVYEDETSTPILTGTMALLDSGNTAGFYSEQITLSAANGFEKGKSYNIYISATVNSVAGATVRNLQIEAEVDSNSVSNIGANVITAASIATGAIDADAIADNAIDAGAIASDAITSAKIADNAITAAKINADAITAAKLHSDVTTELQSGLATAANLATVAGYLDTEIAAILEDTNELQTDLTDGGRLDLLIDAILEDTGTTLDDLVDNIEARLGTPSDLGSGATVAANLVDIEAQTDDIGAAGAGLTAADDAILTAIAALNDLSATEVENAVWDAVLADHQDADSTGEALGDAGAAGDPWNTALPGAYGAGTAGKIVGDNINATISSRATQTSVDDLPTNAELATSQAAADDATLAAIAALNNLSQANVRSAVGLASANLDDQFDAIPAALLDLVDGVETDITLREALRLVLSALVGKLSGAATTTVTIRDANDTTDRITATVDADGNRSAVTLDAS